MMLRPETRFATSNIRQVCLSAVLGGALGLLCCATSSHLLGAPPLLQAQTAFQRGLLAFQRNEAESALADFTAAETEQPQDAGVHNFRGLVLAKLGRTSEAAAEYREAIRLAPQLGAAHRNLGFLEWNEHRLESAITQLDTALQLAPEDNFARYYLARVELELHRYDAAFRHLGASATPLPDDPGVLLQAAKGYLALGRQREANATLSRLASMRLPGVQTAQLAASLVALHQTDPAIRLLQGWSQNHSHEDSRWDCNDLALTYLVAGRYEDASVQARQIVSTPARSEPLDAASAWSLIGIANAHLKHQEQAIEALRRAASLAPDQEDHWLNLTRELMECSRFTDAIAATKEAILAHPESYALQLRLGAADLAVDRYADAETVFRGLITAGDPLPMSSVGLAQVLLRTGRADEAVAELDQATQRLGRSFLLSYFEGLAYSRAGEPSKAAVSFRNALEQNPQSAEAHFELGKTELQLGHFEASISELQRSLQQDGANLPARRLLRQASQRNGAPIPADKITDPLPPNLPADAAQDFILPEWQNPDEGPRTK